MKRFIDEITTELDRAKLQHPEWPTDIIHMVSIMNEESGETIRAALNHRYHGDKLEEVWTECVQTGAMVLRCMENIESMVIEERDGQLGIF